jgi:hypothetical protein
MTLEQMLREAPPTDELHRGTVPEAYRHPRSRRPRRGIGFDDGAGGLVAALATGLIASAITLFVLLRLVSPASQAVIQTEDDGPAVADVRVERVIAELPDGRHAMASFTLRMRAEGLPDGLLTAASLTPTPVERSAKLRTPAPRELLTAESVVRERVTSAMTSLDYEDTVGVTGKDRLRATVRDAVNEALPGAPVTEVYIREYLVK